MRDSTYCFVMKELHSRSCINNDVTFKAKPAADVGLLSANRAILLAHSLSD